MAMLSQVQSKVDEKPNMAILPKLRCRDQQQAWGEGQDSLGRLA
jgi:hypothetical protein